MNWIDEMKERAKKSGLSDDVAEFLLHSNAIEQEYRGIALDDAVTAWRHAEKIVFQAMSERNLARFSLTDILTIHKKLMCRLAPRIAGRIRTDTVIIADRECPPEELRERLQTLLCWRPRSAEEVKKWHVQFEIIHPFEDGNGRTGRIIMNAQRLTLGLPVHVIHVGKEQQEYYTWFKEE